MNIELERKDVRIDRWLKQFESLFPAFRRTWDDEQLRQYWIPAVKMMSMEQVKDLLDYYTFRYTAPSGRITKGPLPSEFLNRCRRIRQQPREENRAPRANPDPDRAAVMPDLTELKRSLEEYS